MSDGVVVVYFSRLGEFMYTHEKVILSVVAKAIAQIKGARFAGLYDNAESYSGNVFFVPDDTLMLDEASCLGIRRPTDLFGAVVPYPFVKTTLRRVTVMHAPRIELTGFGAEGVPNLKAKGLIGEIISWKLRLFLPMSDDGPRILGKLLTAHPAIAAPPPAA
jgi:uncharacterized protein DUF3182